MTTDSDARRLAIEVISTLVNIKRTAADLILRKAAVPEPLIKRFLSERDPATGTKRSKRDAAAMILEEVAKTGQENEVVRNLIAVASEFSAFHLSQDEFVARGVQQKAATYRGILEENEAKARAAAAADLEAAQRDRQKEQREMVERQSKLLLAQFDELARSDNPQHRGYMLEDLLNRAFDLHGITVHKSFRRNDGGEQIDAAFEFDGWHYLVECRWREQLADIRQLDGLSGQVTRSGRQTMGVFLSINGWSPNVIQLLKQNPEKAIFLMEGFDLRAVLEQRIDMRRLLKGKIAALNLEAEPYRSVLTMI
ncbi:hypothetical protein [Rhizobium laguerreae]|uniref:hypothetical protein n=1 Tax=Rhizobium laguerreae TaxID=1076926 RepID=UPI001C90C4F7|nr:hypothetical protein [Rhizobium laguerreae]MBY3168875.1 hypothetical protein [Rhizobium laguerreae]